VSKPTLNLDRGLLDAAARDLGLTLPVWPTIERLQDRKRPLVFIGGRYHGPDVIHRAHRLSVNPYQTPEAATRSLVHELVHAAQCERWGSWHRFDSEYERQLRERGITKSDPDFYHHYREIPFEAEAFAAMVDHPFGLILSDPSGKVVSGPDTIE